MHKALKNLGYLTADDLFHLNILGFYTKDEIKKYYPNKINQLLSMQPAFLYIKGFYMGTTAIDPQYPLCKKSSDGKWIVPKVEILGKLYKLSDLRNRGVL